ncbi:hypothetical protein FB451DRAFT_1388414 [Mycena latifolia]|nr:hypothetical protein FB451DRAFT_1388414 [Mycena latifolia]
MAPAAPRVYGQPYRAPYPRPPPPPASGNPAAGGPAPPPGPYSEPSPMTHPWAPYASRPRATSAIREIDPHPLLAPWQQQQQQQQQSPPPPQGGSGQRTFQGPFHTSFAPVREASPPRSGKPGAQAPLWRRPPPQTREWGLDPISAAEWELECMPPPAVREPERAYRVWRTVSLGTFVFPRLPFPYVFPPAAEEQALALPVAEREGAGAEDDGELLALETRATVLFPAAHLPATRPARPRVWGGGLPGARERERERQPQYERHPSGPQQHERRPSDPARAPPPHSASLSNSNALPHAPPNSTANSNGHLSTAANEPRRLYTDDSDVVGRTEYDTYDNVQACCKVAIPTCASLWTRDLMSEQVAQKSGQYSAGTRYEQKRTSWTTLTFEILTEYWLFSLIAFHHFEHNDTI